MLPCPPWSHDVNDVTHDIVDHYDDDNPVVVRLIHTIRGIHSVHFVHQQQLLTEGNSKVAK